jgi:hypothetical protein
MTFKWDGAAGKDAMKRRREQKRKEAEERNAQTLPENRRAYRREHGTGTSN